MTAFGDHLNFFAKAVNGTTRHGNAGGRFQRHMGNDLLAAADTAKNTARMVALETVFGDFVAVLAATQRYDVKTMLIRSS